VDGAFILEGFPSVSLTGVLTSGYLVEKLKLPLVAAISSSKFPARCVIEKGMPVHPLRIFGNKSVVVLQCEFQIPKEELAYEIVEAVIDFAKRHHSPLIITVEGVPTNATSETDPKINFISTQREFAAKMTAFGHKPVSDGVISGVTGLLLAEGYLSSVDVASILPPTSAKYPDAMSSVHVVNCLNKLYPDLKVDVKPLAEKAETLQKTVSTFMEQERKNLGPSPVLYG